MLTFSEIVSADYPTTRCGRSRGFPSGAEYASVAGIQAGSAVENNLSLGGFPRGIYTMSRVGIISMLVGDATLGARRGREIATTKDHDGKYRRKIQVESKFRRVTREIRDDSELSRRCENETRYARNYTRSIARVICQREPALQPVLNSRRLSSVIDTRRVSERMLLASPPIRSSIGIVSATTRGVPARK